MPLTPVAFEPGVNTSDSAYLASKGIGVAGQRLVHGQWVSSTNVRFWNGQPQKRNGWSSFSLAGVSIRGVARSMRDWLGVDNVSRTVIGASNGLFLLANGVLSEITPYVYLHTESGSINFATTDNSPSVVITSGSAVSVGDWVFVDMEGTVGGIQLNQYVQVTALGSGTFTVNAVADATSTASSAVAALMNFPHVALGGSGPLQTTSGSSIVRVVTGLGSSLTPNVGDIAYIDGATSVGGLSVNGQWPVVAAGLATISVDVGTPASSGATGGGSGVVLTLNASNLNNPSYLQPGWTLSAYGGLMSVCCIGGTLDFYDPVAGGRAYPIQNAPTQVNAHFVTPERFIVALGTASSPLQMAWCDQQVPTDWTSTAANTANSGRNLIGGSYFISGIAVSDGVSFLLTDRCAFLMQYTGDNEVYSTPRVADNAGGVSPWCVVVLGGIAYWRGDYDFWLYNGTVTKIPSTDIHEQVFSNEQYASLNKCISGTNRQWNEVWFYDVAAGNSEIDRLVVLQVDMGCWTSEQDDGMQPSIPLRTAWMDSNLFDVPYAVDVNGVVYQQETGADAAGAAMRSAITSSLMDMSDGNASIYFAGVIPDFAYLTGTLGISITTQYYPGDIGFTDATQGPITANGSNFTDYIWYRQDGKLFSVEFSDGTLGTDWRLGQFRVDISPQSQRR